MNIVLYKYKHEYFQTLFLCKDLYTELCKNDCINLEEYWNKTRTLLNKKEFYIFLHKKDEPTLYLFNDFISILEDDIIPNFYDNYIAGIISDTYGELIGITGKDLEYDKHIYSITYFWMLIMSKAMMKFKKSSQYYTDNVGDMMDTFLYFGYLHNSNNEYPIFIPNIPRLIENKKLTISFAELYIEKNIKFHIDYLS